MVSFQSFLYHHNSKVKGGLIHSLCGNSLLCVVIETVMNVKTVHRVDVSACMIHRERIQTQETTNYSCVKQVFHWAILKFKLHPAPNSCSKIPLLWHSSSMPGWCSDTEGHGDTVRGHVRQFHLFFRPSIWILIRFC